MLRLHEFHNLELVMIDGTLDVGDRTLEMWGSTPVTLRAPVDSTEVDGLYSRIDVLLAPSIWPESYGLVVREALHFGCWGNRQRSWGAGAGHRRRRERIHRRSFAFGGARGGAGAN